MQTARHVDRQTSRQIDMYIVQIDIYTVQIHMQKDRHDDRNTLRQYRQTCIQYRQTCRHIDIQKCRTDKDSFNNSDSCKRKKNRPKILEIEYFGLFFSYISQRKMFSVFDTFLGNLKSYAINTSFSFKQYSGNRGETI